MRPTFDSDPGIDTEPTPTDGKHIGQMTNGLIASSGLHLLVTLFLVFGLVPLTRAPPHVAQIVSINLVQFGDKTTSRPSLDRAPVPQEQAREISKSDPAEAVPVANQPPPQPPHHETEEKSPPDLITATMPDEKPKVSHPVKRLERSALPAAKLQRGPSPEDDLATRLKLLAQLRQLTPPNPRPQDGSGSSSVSATSANAARARDATHSVKDFVRAQVERRWNLDGNTVKGGELVVAIHIVLNPDGSVSRAEIIDNPRYSSDSAYQDFALSARNAVLLSSPLTVPPGEYDIAKDIVLEFNSKQVLQ